MNGAKKRGSGMERRGGAEVEGIRVSVAVTEKALERIANRNCRTLQGDREEIFDLLVGNLDGLCRKTAEYQADQIAYQMAMSGIEKQEEFFPLEKGPEILATFYSLQDRLPPEAFATVSVGHWLSRAPDSQILAFAAAGWKYTQRYPGTGFSEKDPVGWITGRRGVHPTLLGIVKEKVEESICCIMMRIENKTIPSYPDPMKTALEWLAEKRTLLFLAIIDRGHARPEDLDGADRILYRIMRTSPELLEAFLCVSGTERGAKAAAAMRRCSGFARTHMAANSPEYEEAPEL